MTRSTRSPRQPRLARSLLAAVAVWIVAVAGPVPGRVAAQDSGATPPAVASSSVAKWSEVPLEHVEGRLLVPVWIAGLGEQLFLLDTAAGASVVSTRLRDRLAPGADDIRADSVRGASGVAVMDRVRLARVRVGPAEREAVWAVVADIGDFREYDGRPVEGILGVDVLAGHDLVVDIPGGVLRLIAADADAADAADAAAEEPAGVPFTSRIQAGFVEFEATVGGRPVRAILDSGARRSVLNWAAARLAGVSPDDEGVRATERGSRGIDGQSRIASHLAVVDGLAIGDRRLPPAEVKVADLGIFEAVGLGDRPAMLVGVDVLLACPVRIAYSTGRLHLCP